MNDLRTFNVTANSWTDLTPAVLGDIPPSIAQFGMCALDEKIFVFGGWLQEGGKAFLLFVDVFLCSACSIAI